MPTGYTAAIQHGISFERFIMDCARAFGACVTLRDEVPGGDAIPLVFQPNLYHFHAMELLTQELEELQAMSDDDAHLAAADEWELKEQGRKKKLEEEIAMRVAYKAMLVKVEAWTPPTSEHQGLKRFMREQIERGLDFDCCDEFYRDVTPRIAGPRWRTLRMAEKSESLAYHTKQHQKEVENAARSTEWVRALRESIGVQSTPALNEGE